MLTCVLLRLALALALPRRSSTVATAPAAVAKAAARGALLVEAPAGGVALAGVGSHVQASQASRVAERNPKPPSWFPGGFAQGESTYTDEGVDAYSSGSRTESGYDFGYSMPFVQHATKDSRWFAETPSAGDADAWQTYYPKVAGSSAGNRYVKNPTWVSTPEGWVEEYVPHTLVSQPGLRRPGWFDSSVNNIDGFGRPKLPDSTDPRRTLDLGITNTPWVERSVNTTLECAEIGCTANASLYAFNPASEEAQNCRLSIAVHATDFDNDFGNEHIANLLVNSYNVRPQCEPMAGGCSNASQAALHSCLNGYSVDHLSNENGTFLVQGTLNRMVDECPYNGNLFSGVVVTTCLVRNRTALTASTASLTNLGAVGSADAAAEAEAGILSASEASATLSCNTPGCTAFVLMNINPFNAMNGGSCQMNVTMVSTDFDDNHGVVEQVDFVNVSGLNVGSNLTSGSNPCTSRLQGQEPSPDQLNYALVSNLNVTDAVAHPPAGSMNVTIKISDYVDECATPAGNLLEATVFIRCTPGTSSAANASSNATSNATALLQAKEVAAEPRRFRLSRRTPGGITTV